MVCTTQWFVYSEVCRIRRVYGANTSRDFVGVVSWFYVCFTQDSKMKSIMKVSISRNGKKAEIYTIHDRFQYQDLYVATRDKDERPKKLYLIDLKDGDITYEDIKESS